MASAEVLAFTSSALLQDVCVEHEGAETEEAAAEEAKDEMEEDDNSRADMEVDPQDDKAQISAGLSFYCIPKRQQKGTRQFDQVARSKHHQMDGIIDQTKTFIQKKQIYLI